MLVMHLENWQQMLEVLKILPTNIVLTFLVALFERGLLGLLFFQLSGKRINFQNLAIFTLVVVLLPIIPAYFLGAWFAPILPNYDILKFLFTLQNPLLFFVYYYLFVKLVPMSKTQSVKAAEYLYLTINILMVFFIATRFALLIAFGGTVQFSQNPYYLVSDGLAQLIIIPFYFFGYLMLRHIFTTSDDYLVNHSVISEMGNHRLAKSFGHVCLTFVLSFAMIYWMNSSLENLFIIFLVCMLILIGNFVIACHLDNKHVQKLEEQNSHPIDM